MTWSNDGGTWDAKPVSASGRSRSQVQMGGLAARRAEGAVASNHNVAGQASILE